jgi:multidrug efflux pump subunit AcrB
MKIIPRANRYWLLLIAIGAISAVALAVLLVWHFWPEPKRRPSIAVVTYYPGMPASSVEKTITNRIERWVNQAPGCSRVTSRSIAGVSIVEVQFRDDIEPSDALATVNSLALNTLPTLPPNTLPPVVLPFDPSSELGVLVVTNAAMNEVKLKDLAQTEVRSLLGAIPGLAAQPVIGGKERTVAISLDPNRMAAHAVSPLEVVNALRTDNRMVMPRVQVLAENRLLIDNAAAGDNIDDLNKLPIKTVDGREIFLRDIGHAEDSYAVSTSMFRFNGQATVAVPIYYQKGFTAAAVRRALTEALPGMESKLGQGTKLEFVPLGTGDLLTVYLRAPSGLRIEQTQKRVPDLEEFLMREIPVADRAGICTQIGVNPDWSALYTTNAGPQDAFIRVHLTRNAGTSVRDYAVKLRQSARDEPKFADLQLRFAVNGEAPLIVRIEGGTPEQAMAVAKEVRDKISTLPDTADVYVVQRNDAPFLVIEVDRRKAADVGLTVSDVIQQLTAVLNSGFAFGPKEFDTKSSNAYSVSVPWPDGPNRDLQDALNIPAVGTGAVQPLKLSALVNVSRRQDAVEIHHLNLQRVVEVSADVVGRNRSRVVSSIDKALKEIAIPGGMTVQRADERY